MTVRIGEGVDRPSAELVDPFQELPTAVLADVTTEQTIMHHQIKPVSTATRVAGTALTVSAPPADNLVVHKAVTLASPGDVIVVDAKGYAEAAIWGELLSLSAQAHDIAGTVVDGAVRDLDDLDELGYPVYARSVCPRPPEKCGAGAINVPVTCGGRTVEPGDIVVGDRDGVAVIPPAQAADVRSAAEAKLQREANLQAEAKSGTYLYDTLDLDERFDRHDVESVPLAPDEDTDDDSASR